MHQLSPRPSSRSRRHYETERREHLLKDSSINNSRSRRDEQTSNGNPHHTVGSPMPNHHSHQDKNEDKNHNRHHSSTNIHLNSLAYGRHNGTQQQNHISIPIVTTPPRNVSSINNSAGTYQVRKWEDVRDDNKGNNANNHNSNNNYNQSYNQKGMQMNTNHIQTDKYSNNRSYGNKYMPNTSNNYLKNMPNNYLNNKSNNYLNNTLNGHKNTNYYSSQLINPKSNHNQTTNPQTPNPQKQIVQTLFYIPSIGGYHLNNSKQKANGQRYAQNYRVNSDLKNNQVESVSQVANNNYNSTNHGNTNHQKHSNSTHTPMNHTKTNQPSYETKKTFICLCCVNKDLAKYRQNINKQQKLKQVAKFGTIGTSLDVRDSFGGRNNDFKRDQMNRTHRIELANQIEEGRRSKEREKQREREQDRREGSLKSIKIVEDKTREMEKKNTYRAQLLVQIAEKKEAEKLNQIVQRVKKEKERKSQDRLLSVERQKLQSQKQREKNTFMEELENRRQQIKEKKLKEREEKEQLQRNGGNVMSLTMPSQHLRELLEQCGRCGKVGKDGQWIDGGQIESSRVDDRSIDGRNETNRSGFRQRNVVNNGIGSIMVEDNRNFDYSVPVGSVLVGSLPVWSIPVGSVPIRTVPVRDVVQYQRQYNNNHDQKSQRSSGSRQTNNVYGSHHNSIIANHSNHSKHQNHSNHQNQVRPNRIYTEANHVQNIFNGISITNGNQLNPERNHLADSDGSKLESIRPSRKLFESQRGQGGAIKPNLTGIKHQEIHRKYLNGRQMKAAGGNHSQAN